MKQRVTKDQLRKLADAGDRDALKAWRYMEEEGMDVWTVRVKPRRHGIKGVVGRA